MFSKEDLKMKKISKSMAKKIALMVLLSSAVGMHSVWAYHEPKANEIEILSRDGASTTKTLRGTGVDSTVTTGADDTGIGVTGGAMGSTVKKISTYEDLSLGVFGIQVTNTNSVSATSITNGIDVKTTTGMAAGISFGFYDNDETKKGRTTGTNSIAGLGDIKVEGSSTIMGIYANSGTNTVTFSDTKSITATGGVVTSGIYLEGKDSSKVSGLSKIEVTGSGNAYGINMAGSGATGGDDPIFTIEFDETGGSISAYSSSSDVNTANYGINASGGTKVTNVNKIEAGFAGVTISGGRALGIYLGDGVNTVEFTGEDSSITAKSNTKGVAGITAGNGSAMVSGLKTITVEGGTTTYYQAVPTGIAVSSGAELTVAGLEKISVTAAESGEARSISVTGSGATRSTLILQPETKTDNIYITADAAVTVSGTATLQFNLPSDVDAQNDTILKITGGAGSSISGDARKSAAYNPYIYVNLGGLSINHDICLISDSNGITLGNYTCWQSTDGTKWEEGEVYLANNDTKLMFSSGVCLKPTAGDSNIIVVGVNAAGENYAEGYSGSVPKKGKAWKDVYGGLDEEGSTNITGKDLTIKGGTISGDVFGGYSKDGSVTGNKVTIEGGLIKGNVYAGYIGGSTATVDDNKLYWTGGTIKGERIVANMVEISGTGATYLGEDGMIGAVDAEENPVLVTLTGTLTVGADKVDEKIASKLTFTSGVNAKAGSELKIANEAGEVTLKKDSTVANVTGAGTLKLDGATLSTNGGRITTAITGDGSLIVKSGTLVYEPEAETAKIKVPVTIVSGAELDPVADVFAETVTNRGTLELKGGTLGTTITNTEATLKVTSPVTIDAGGAVTLDARSTLEIEAKKFEFEDKGAIPADKAAITGITSANFTLADGAKIQLLGETDDEKYYVLFVGDENVLTKEFEEQMEKSLRDKDGEEYSETETYTSTIEGAKVIAVQVSNLNPDEMNLNSLAGIQQGMVSMQNITVDTVAAHMGLINKAKGEGKYAKEIWASYLNNKDNVDGFNMAKYDAKYNGVTVGVDFYSSEKSVAGVALTYAKGDVSGNGIKSGIRNDSKYYGISFYDRVDLKNSALLLDLGYMNSKNDTNVSTTSKSVTGDAKVDSYTLGVRWEKDYKFKNSKLVPFAGVRYLRLNSKDFGNSRGLNYSTTSQNLFQPKIGVAWAGDYKMKDRAWNFKPKAEVGYLWALGNREADTALNYKGHDKGNVLYDVTDKSSYYAKLGIEFNHKKFAAGVDYSYMKGSSVRSNRWNVNLSWSF